MEFFMNNSLLKIILFFIPLISYATSFGMKNNGKKITAIKKIYTQKSNLINKKNATKLLLLNCLIEAKNTLAVDLSQTETKALRLVCKAFAFYAGYRNNSSSDLPLMPDDIEKQYNRLCPQNTDPIKQKENIQLIFYSTLLSNNNTSINWVLQLNKHKSFKLRLHTQYAREEHFCQEYSITPALALVNNPELTKNDLLAGILSNEWSKKSPLSEQEISKLKTTTQESLSGINPENYTSFIPYIIYTSLDRVLDLQQLNCPDNKISLTKKGTEHLLYISIHKTSPECFQYLTKTEYGMEISSKTDVNFNYFFRAIWDNRPLFNILTKIKQLRLETLRTKNSPLI